MAEGSAGGAGITQWVSIAGNIKQQYLPFVLKPSSNLNLNINDNNELTDGPQFFSFKKEKGDDYKAGYGRLNICPSVMRSPEFGLFFNKDISNTLLYDYGNKDPITIDSFLERIPSIQIREFQVDSKLDQFLNLLYDIFRAVGGDIFDNPGKIFNKDFLSKIEKLGPKIKTALKTAFNYLTNVDDYPNMFFDKNGNSRWDLKNAGKGAMVGMAAGAVIGGPIGAAAGAAMSSPPIDTFIQTFPFIMYYKMQSCTTTNIYEVPCVVDSMWRTEGENGWSGQNAFSLKKNDNNDSGVMDKVMAMVTGMGSELYNRIKIHYMPRWDAAAGTEGPYDEITIQFDLFNDTAEAAMYNFIFVNTIIPNNMWLQYNMLTHSQCLYDIKIEGVKRLFACAGSFEVKPQGLMRTPTDIWIDKLCDTYANCVQSKKNGRYDPLELSWQIKENNLIRIPDVYTVSLKFKSRLPQNFNNFLFNYSRNCNMETYKNQHAYSGSIFDSVLSNIKIDLVEKIKADIEKNEAAAAEQQQA